MAQQYGNSNGISVKMAGPFGSSVGSASKLTSITLPAVSWKGAISPYFQAVEVGGVSVNSRVDLLPSAEQAEYFRNHCIALMADNDGGNVTVYALGDKPAEDIIIQATILEVIA